MSWYYAENNERRGPVEDAAFDGLVTSGAVRPETLVWREGMTNWQPLSASSYRRSGSLAVPGAAGEEEPGRPPKVEMGICSESGRILPRDELVEIDGRLVSAEYKNVVLQRIREGVGATGSLIDPEVLAQQIIARDYHLSAGSCLSRGWRLLANHFWLCVGASFLTGLVMLASVFTIIGPFFVFGPLSAGLYWMMLKLHRGEAASLGDAFAGFTRSFWHLVGVGVITILAMISFFVPAFISLIVELARDPKSIPVLAVVLVIAGYVALIYLTVCWVFSFFLVIDKGLDAWPAMKLSRRIVLMHPWQVFAVLFVLGLIMLGMMVICPVLSFFIAGAQANPATAEWIRKGFSLLSFCISICFSPWLYSTIVVAYEDIFGSGEGHP